MRSCQLVIGRLVSHPCGHKTRVTCGTCRRPVCDAHLDARSGVCLQCLGRHTPPAAPIFVSEAELMSFSEDELGAFDHSGPVPVDQRRDS